MDGTEQRTQRRESTSQCFHFSVKASASQSSTSGQDSIQTALVLPLYALLLHVQMFPTFVKFSVVDLTTCVMNPTLICCR